MRPTGKQKYTNEFKSTEGFRQEAFTIMENMECQKNSYKYSQDHKRDLATNSNNIIIVGKILQNPEVLKSSFSLRLDFSLIIVKYIIVFIIKNI